MTPPLPDPENCTKRPNKDPTHRGDGDCMSDTRALSEPGLQETDLDGNVEEYTAMMESWEKSPKTIEHYVKFIRRAAAVMGDRDPLTWAREDLRKYIVTPTFKSWSAATRNLSTAALKSYWRALDATDLLSAAGSAFVYSANKKAGNRAQDLRDQCPTYEEQQLARTVARDVILTSDIPLDVYRHSALWFANSYGIRRKGVSNIRVCDVDPEKNTLHVHMTKGDKSRTIPMDIPLTPEMWERILVSRSSIIQRLLTKAEEDGVSHAVAKLNELLRDREAPLFFVRTEGGNGDIGDPLSEEHTGDIIKRVGTAILDRHVNPHSWRHSKVYEVHDKMELKDAEVLQYFGWENIVHYHNYLYTNVEDLQAAYARGNSEPSAAPLPASTPSPVPQPSGVLDVAVNALTDLLTAGTLSPAAYASAVAALGGSS